MNNKILRTPFSTQLSGSAKETEIRIRNLFSGPKKRPPIPFLILMFSVCIFCGNIVSCQMKEETPPDISSPNGSAVSSSNTGQSTPADQDPDARLNEMVLEYLRAMYNATIYLAADAPDTPQDGDYRLDSAILLGTDTLDGELLGLYQINYSGVYAQSSGALEWSAWSPAYLVSRMYADGSPAEFLVRFDYYREGMDPGDAIRQAVWGLTDLEVCLFRDGLSTPIGPGNWVEPMFLDFEPEVSVFEEGEPIYQPGDYWENWSIDGGGDNGGVSALRYYIAAENRWSLQRLETGRADMVTPRGIRVGATREEVLAAYPGLLSDEKNWTWAYPDDYLWYCANENGLGPCLYFFFADDTVYMIQMVDMFN